MKILFLCVANSARSQIAEGLAKSMFQGRAEICSAGSNPSGLVHPVAIQAMREIGIDISKQYSKSWNQLTAEFMSDLDFLITLCNEECPSIGTRAKKIGWGIQDPAAATSGAADTLTAFRKARDEIRARVEEFGRDHGLI